MGDRAYTRIDVATAHAVDGSKARVILDEWGFSDDSDGATDDSQSFADPEANYGAEDTRSELREAKIPFFGYHAEGGGYEACLFAFDGKTYADVNCSDGRVMVAFNETTNRVDPDSLKGARLYVRVYKRAVVKMQRINAKAPAPEVPNEPTNDDGGVTDIERQNDERTAREVRL